MNDKLRHSFYRQAREQGCDPEESTKFADDQMERWRKNMEASHYEQKEAAKKICVNFYYWWHNQPGVNTEQGFDEWWESMNTKQDI